MFTKVYKEEDFAVSNWVGGKTKQLAIFPDNGDYLERKFVWRLSTATCELDESNFSKLPDFQRILVVLRGSVVLSHEGERVAKLNELEMDAFDGAYRTKSFGRITDYNLMISKGNKGFADVLQMSAESRKLQPVQLDEYGMATQGFFCRDGFATISVNGEVYMVAEGEQLVINYDIGETPELSAMGEGNVVWCQIFYNYHEEEMGPIEIPRERVTFDDFKSCVFLANTQFRGAKYIFKSMKTTWKDEALSSAINKIERIYLPVFIWILGICAVLWITVDNGEIPVGKWAVMTLVWTLATMFIIAPLIYLAVVPKPVRKHIKNIDELTPYEKKVMEAELGRNERLERVLRRYKHTGREVYDEDGNRKDEIKPFDFLSKD